MKKIIILILLAIGMQGLPAQEVESSLGEARQAWDKGELENTRHALQQALYELDIAIGKEILKLLPENMGTMQYKEEKEEVGSASLGYAGLYVSRAYTGHEDTDASLQIIADSPLLAGVNALLALPVIGDPNRKRIRVGTYRAVLIKSEDDDGALSWGVQVPFGASLLNFSVNGVTEKEVVDMANTIPLEQIARLIQ